MKISTLKYGLSLLLIASVYFSCKPKGPKNLIVGTWLINDNRMKAPGDSIKVEIAFLHNGLTTYNTYINGRLSNIDSATYNFSNDGQYLVTKLKGSGLVDSVKIIELTDQILKVKSEHVFDTLTITLTRK